MHLIHIFVELILNLIAPILVFFRFNPHITNKKVFKEHKDEIKNGLMTISNHVFPWDNVVLRTLRPFKRMEMPIWKEGAESTSGEMYRLAGGIPVPFTMRGLYHLMNAMDEVIKDKGWLHVYPEAACWEYYCPIRDFKEGSFKIAVNNKIPVFPIAFSFRKATGIFKLLVKKEVKLCFSSGPSSSFLGSFIYGAFAAISFISFISSSENENDDNELIFVSSITASPFMYYRFNA